VKHGKPDPESLLFCRKRAMGKYGLMGEDACAAYIGDSVDDVRASKNADFYSIGVLSALEDAGERKRLRAEFEALHCDLILEDAGKLVKILS
jgi:phosphoglycolate phosphatase-like HAD superfamily hydrolase